MVNSSNLSWRILLLVTETFLRRAKTFYVYPYLFYESPLLFSFANFVFLGWTIYACMKKDYFIFWANMPGLVLGLYYCLSILPFLSKKVCYNRTDFFPFLIDYMVILQLFVFVYHELLWSAHCKRNNETTVIISYLSFSFFKSYICEFVHYYVLIDLSICLSIHMLIYLHAYIFAFYHTYLFIHLSIYLSIYVYIYIVAFFILSNFHYFFLIYYLSNIIFSESQP